MTPEFIFSVVIPVYNREQQIVETVQSVLRQDHQSFEVIVVNDGSTDGTLQALNTIKDIRLHVITQENAERGAARNKGCAASRGKFITFLDSDDEFLPGHLKAAEQFISSQASDIKMFCTGYYKETGNGVEEVRIPDDIHGNLLSGNFLSCNGVFLPRETALQFPFSENRFMSGLEDWELWLRITSQVKAAGKNLMTSRMRYHKGRSVLQTEPTEIENRFSEFVNAIKASGLIKNPESEKTFMASCESYMALHLALTGKYRKEAMQHLKSAFRWKREIVFSRRFYATLKHLL
jgi:glycosyltransferase involved in cell wall biosynthesis